MKNERIYYWDNLKCCLIFFVVLGHFLIPISNESRSLQTVYFFIYLFHMPAFVFASGFFSKYYMKKEVPNISKLMGFLLLYFIFKILLWGVNSILQGQIAQFQPMTETGAPWYLMAMFVWYVFLPVFSKFKASVCIGTSIVIGIASGFLSEIGPFFCLSRIIVFLPFFLAGYYFTGNKIEDLTKKWKRFVAIIILLCIAFMILNNLENISIFQGIIYGNRPYDIFSKVASSQKVAFLRLGWYAVAFIMTFAVMVLTPKRKLKISYIGSRTLSIYIIHRLIRQIFSYYDLYHVIHLDSKIMLLCCIVVSIFVTLLLSGKRLFTIFQRIFEINYDKILK